MRTRPTTKADDKAAGQGADPGQGQLAPAGAAIADQRPEWMTTGDGDGSMDLLRGYVRPPRVKVVQGQAKAPFNELFRPGDLCAVPMMRPVWTEGFEDRAPNLAFHFVPVLFYPEWVVWNPYGTDLPPVRVDEQGAPMRSLDPKSELAVRSRNPARRREPCRERPTTPDGKPAFVSYLEHLNFVVMILPPNEMAELPIILSFSSGEHRAGTNFATLLQQRRAKHLYGCQFAAHVSRRTNKYGTWFGVDVDNPAAGSSVAPYVQDRERFEALGRVHAEYRSYLDDRRIQVELGDEDAVAGEAHPADATDM